MFIVTRDLLLKLAPSGRKRVRYRRYGDSYCKKQKLRLKFVPTSTMACYIERGPLNCFGRKVRWWCLMPDFLMKWFMTCSELLPAVHTVSSTTGLIVGITCFASPNPNVNSGNITSNWN